MPLPPDPEDPATQQAAAATPKETFALLSTSEHTYMGVHGECMVVAGGDDVAVRARISITIGGDTPHPHHTSTPPRPLPDHTTPHHTSHHIASLSHRSGHGHAL